MDESQKHYAKGKEARCKDHVLHDSIYMKYPEKTNPRQKVD